MIDHKYSYLNNVIRLYNTFGYRSLTTYDKYHIILNIITIFTDNYKYNLGQLVTKLKPKLNSQRQVIFNESALTLEKLSILKAWAEVYIVSMKNEIVLKSNFDTLEENTTGGAGDEERQPRQRGTGVQHRVRARRARRSRS